MIWRLALAMLAFMITSTPATAQLFGIWDDGYGRPRSSGDHRSSRSRLSDFEEPRRSRGRSARKSLEVQHGGPQPAITPKEPEKVTFPNEYGTGTVVIDTAGRKLYYVLSETEAYRYPISVGREGFRWTGTEMISRKAEWPDWHPPEEMRERDSSLPKRMTGGKRNPLGAMALYLGETLYRIHGTNDTKSLGRASSSGCFRMRNADVLHLASLVEIGTIVEVMKRLPPEQSGALAEAKL